METRILLQRAGDKIRHPYQTNALSCRTVLVQKVDSLLRQKKMQLMMMDGKEKNLMEQVLKRVKLSSSESMEVSLSEIPLWLVKQNV